MNRDLTINAVQTSDNSYELLVIADTHESLRNLARCISDLSRSVPGEFFQVEGHASHAASIILVFRRDEKSGLGHCRLTRTEGESLEFTLSLDSQGLLEISEKLEHLANSRGNCFQETSFGATSDANIEFRVAQ